MKVVVAGPMPPEVTAYTLARYSRSPGSFVESLDWVRSRDSSKFLEDFYFAYGHASIADLGHVTMSLEDISEIAAIEVEDEQLWDGQAKSTRYQDFSRCHFITPRELSTSQVRKYVETATLLLETYALVTKAVGSYLRKQTPKPEGMSQAAYERTMDARAFDNARYLLFLGIPTNVGQVTSIRTLEKQIQRLGAVPQEELRAIAAQMQKACGEPPILYYNTPNHDERLPVAPTLAKHLRPNNFREEMKRAVREWVKEGKGGKVSDWLGAENLFERRENTVRLHTPPRCPDAMDIEACATLLYTVSDYPYTHLLTAAKLMGSEARYGLLKAALGTRSRHDELPREFRSAPFAFDMVMDIGAYRDLHRHRRCQQFRQEYTADLGYEIPEDVIHAGVYDEYCHAMSRAHELFNEWKEGGLEASVAAYILPFGTRIRTLFKMDFAETDYICRLRSGVKGHFSYRKIAWEMYSRAKEVAGFLGDFMEATHPDIEDVLTR